MTEQIVYINLFIYVKNKYILYSVYVYILYLLCAVWRNKNATWIFAFKGFTSFYSSYSL